MEPILRVETITAKRGGSGPVSPYETAEGVRPEGVDAQFVCFKDPDGTILEYAQFAGTARDVLNPSTR